MDPTVPEAHSGKIAIYWEETRSIGELTQQGFYSPGWFPAFESIGPQVIRKTPDEFFTEEFTPNVADWHLLLPGTPKFFEGGDFRLFQPPQEGRLALLLEEDLHFNLHHLLIFSQIYDLIILHDWVLYQACLATGARNFLWVPSAYSPDIFHPIAEEQDLDVCFLGDQGKYYHKGRISRFDYAWHLDHYYGKRGLIGLNYYGPQANERYNKSHIVMDFPTYENVGPRVPQVLGSGRMLLMNQLKSIDMAQTHQLIDGVHFASFAGTIEDMRTKIDWYLAHEDERNRIAQAGHQQAPRFTYAAAATKIWERMSHDRS